MTDEEIRKADPYVNPETGIAVAKFERKARVASYQIGAAGNIRLSALLRMEQETGEEHMDGIGMGYEWLMKEQKAFLITTNQVMIHRLPQRNEQLTIITRPLGTSGVQFYREFSFQSEGKEIVRILQVSVVVDFREHKPLRPEKIYEYRIFCPLQAEKKERPPRLRFEEMPKLGERPIRYSDLDRNGHLTNTIYGDIIEDFLPETFRNYHNVQINYQKESKLKDTLELFGEVHNGGFAIQGIHHGEIGFTALIS